MTRSLWFCSLGYVALYALLRGLGLAFASVTLDNALTFGIWLAIALIVLLTGQVQWPKRATGPGFAILACALLFSPFVLGGFVWAFSDLMSGNGYRPVYEQALTSQSRLVVLETPSEGALGGGGEIIAVRQRAVVLGLVQRQRLDLESEWEQNELVSYVRYAGRRVALPSAAELRASQGALRP